MSIRLIIRREAYCLTWWGKLLLALFALGLCVGGAKICGSFLTLTHPVDAEVLVVEGWLPDYALRDAVSEFHRGKYRYVLTAGSPLLTGYNLSGLKSSAAIAAATMTELGLASNLVIAVPGPQVLRGRSLAHAMAIRDWFSSNDPSVRSINVYSLGVHGRRTHLLFEKLLSPKITVGVISHPDAAYDLDRWWASSEGFKTVLEELIGYVWTRVSSLSSIRVNCPVGQKATAASSAGF
jgi:hypothetical protein